MHHDPRCCKYTRSPTPSSSGASSVLLAVVGGILAVLLVAWVVSIIWPFLVGAVVLIGMGAAVKSGKQGR